MKTHRTLILITLLAIVLAACTPAPTPIPPTSTPKPTATNTEIPTATPTTRPTNTPRPTNTKLPTLTPKPTNTPTPMIFTGTGADVVDFNYTEPAIVHIVGNSSWSYFGVKSYDSSGNQVDLLVNTTDAYEGTVPINFTKRDTASRFAVDAVGEWTIEIKPLNEARFVSVPGTVIGNGDDVIVLTGKSPDLAHIVGNSESRYFGVTGYSHTRDLLVNTTDPFDGKVILNKDTVVLVITASGEWTIDVED